MQCGSYVNVAIVEEGKKSALVLGKRKTIFEEKAQELSNQMKRRQSAFLAFGSEAKFRYSNLTFYSWNVKLTLELFYAQCPRDLSCRHVQFVNAQTNKASK